MYILDDGRTKPKSKKSDKSMDVGPEELCLLRASSGKKKISTIVMLNL